MKKKLIAAALVVCALCNILPSAAMAAAPAYKVSDTYAGGEYYERLSRVELTGEWRIDLVNVALSQVGYHEGDSKDDYAGGNFSGGSNFVEYGSVYGGIDAEWCAMFISWCARQAGIPTYIINNASRAATDGAGGTQKYYFHMASYRKANYTPVLGDIVFFSSTGYGTDHVGIVVGFTDTGIITVEGNRLNAVRMNTYDFDNEYIVRYGYYAQPTEMKASGFEYSELEFIHNEGVHGVIPGYKELYSFETLTATKGSSFALPPNAFERAGHKLLGYCAMRTDTGEWYGEGGWKSREDMLYAGEKPYLFRDGSGLMFDGELAEAKSIKMYCLWSRDDGQTICDSSMPPFEGPDDLGWINPYNDIFRGNWFYEAVRDASMAGMINDARAFRFMPDEDCTRRSFVTWLYCINGSPELQTEEGLHFTDVGPGDTAVRWAYENGVFYGISETEFGPEFPLTREQAAVMLFRMLNGTEGGEVSPFLDNDDISDWAYSAVAWAQSQGIIGGSPTEGGFNFLPKNNLSRAEALTLALRCEVWNKTIDMVE